MLYQNRDAVFIWSVDSRPNKDDIYVTPLRSSYFMSLHYKRDLSIMCVVIVQTSSGTRSPDLCLKLYVVRANSEGFGKTVQCAGLPQLLLFAFLVSILFSWASSKLNGLPQLCNGRVFYRFNSNWATPWENLFLPYANNKGADQPAHPRSLISTFVVHCLDSIIPLLSISKFSSL